MPGSAAAATCLCVWEDSVPERAFYGTELTLGAKKGILRYATHFQKPSVLKTGFWGTEGKFGTRNTLLRYEVQFAPSYGTGCSSSFRGALHRKLPSGVWNEAIGCDRCVADPLLPTTFVNYAGKLHNEGCHSIGSLR